MTRGWADLDEDPNGIRLNPADLTERYRVDMLYARAFASEAGQAVLAHLRSQTIEQPAWVPGEDPGFGFAREGQNSIVREIERRIRRAAEGPPQLQQETKNG